jgi:hypothetical protein
LSSAYLVRFGRARAAERVVAPAGVGRDRHQHVAGAGQQAAAGRQVHVALRTNRRQRAVALFLRAPQVVEQCVDGLIALEVDDPERLAALDLREPGGPGPYDLATRGRVGIQRAFDQIPLAHAFPPSSWQL